MAFVTVFIIDPTLLKTLRVAEADTRPSTAAAFEAAPRFPFVAASVVAPAILVLTIIASAALFVSVVFPEIAPPI
jgi:hypothetical protein